VVDGQRIQSESKALDVSLHSAIADDKGESAKPNKSKSNATVLGSMEANPNEGAASQDVTCQLDCDACGFNWYEQEWNNGKPTAHFGSYCECCQGTKEQQADCGVACVTPLSEVKPVDISLLVPTTQGLVSMADLGLGDVVAKLNAGEKWEEEDWGTPQSWNQWSANVSRRKAGQRKIHFLTQADSTSPSFVANTHCTTARLLGAYDGNFFCHGMNRTYWHHDGTKCDDCYWMPNSIALAKKSKAPKRIRTDNTAWPKIRFWQHSLNHPKRLGIEEDDLCLVMDGLDVFPVNDVNELHEAYATFFKGSQEGIMFAGDTKCHPFCQKEFPECWHWSRGKRDSPALATRVASESNYWQENHFRCQTGNRSEARCADVPNDALLTIHLGS
jgi:hypothetical protein